MLGFLSILSTPQKLMIAGGVAAAIFAGGFGFGWHERALREAVHIEDQKEADRQECRSAQDKTKEANDALQKDRDDIAARLASYKLRHPSTCVPVSSGPQLPVSGTEHAGSYGKGLGSDWLREYAATAELYRSSLIICTDFLKKERLPEPANR